MVSMIVLILPRISEFFISVNLRNRGKKKKKKKLETAVKIEKNIENLSSLIKFDQFINLGYFCHVCCCQKDKCGKCLFLCNLWYIFVEIKVNQNFYSIQQLLHSLAEIEREHMKLIENLKNY